MAFPAEQKLEKMRRFPHPPYCSWHLPRTAQGRQLSGTTELASLSLVMGEGSDSGDLWGVAGASVGFPSTKARLSRNSRENGVLYSSKL